MNKLLEVARSFETREDDYEEGEIFQTLEDKAENEKLNDNQIKHEQMSNEIRLVFLPFNLLPTCQYGNHPMCLLFVSLPLEG